jgi:hypothetical protein
MLAFSFTTDNETNLLLLELLSLQLLDRYMWSPSDCTVAVAVAAAVAAADGDGDGDLEGGARIAD